ncbi:MAG TPA: arylamine N-acetyltransferase [Phenylobacterium sp.]|uniref:arylamine N-acetyltransferase family protein n=1 Tax=Phenylobacterium sp. TaxID=1871053 RepID=UPI002C6D8CFE|nr:arylamine N-acetyltransferase [Phenylobacterium sp.]HSV03150.1 arylamine N-acetyltransferase [Phenylobacterium sp.]
MQLAAYLDRIGFAGAPRADRETLLALHRAHLLAIPYENLDVQLGRPVTIAAEAAFEKLVTRRRGGWCYEMNGLFAAALEAIGFSVTRLAGGVVRSLMGEGMVGNHLVLKVDLPGGPWIADVGFGDGPLEAFPLQAGTIRAAGFEHRLEQLAGGWWRFHNHAFGGAPDFDFTEEPADLALLASQCEWLQTAPASPFVLNATAQRHRPGEILVLRGRILKRVRPDAVEDRLIDTASDYVETLSRDFDLDVPEAADLWPRILQRHGELFAQPA